MMAAGKQGLVAAVGLLVLLVPAAGLAQEAVVEDDSEGGAQQMRTSLRFTSTTFAYQETGDDGPPLPGADVAGSNASEVGRVFTDLRGVASAENVAGRWDLKLDGRVRKILSTAGRSFVPDGETEEPLPIQSGLFNGGLDEYDLRELYLQRRGDKLAVRLGRQFVLDVAATKIDGASLRYKASRTWSYVAFGGLFPVRGSRSVETDYPTLSEEGDLGGPPPVAAGVAAAYRTRRSHGALGVLGVLPLTDDIETGDIEEQRLALTANGFWQPSTRFTWFHYVVFDATGAGGSQLTNLSLGVNFRPNQALRVFANVNHVDTQTLNISVQNRLEDVGTNAADAGRIQNNVSVLRTAQSDVRVGVTSSLSQNRYQLSVEGRLRRRPEIILEGNQVEGDVAPPPLLAVPESRAADVTLAVRDRRSVGGLSVGAAITSIFGIGDVNFNGANVFIARADARKALRNNMTEIQFDVSLIRSDDDTVEGCAAMAGVGATFQRGCFATSTLNSLRVGGLLYHRFNSSLVATVSGGVSLIDLSSDIMDPATGATSLDQPLVIGTTGFVRVNYQFR